MIIVQGHAHVEDVTAFIDHLTSIGDTHGCAVQAFDARYIAGPEHLRTAVRLASRAVDRDDMIADGYPIEILLYAAGRRQINRALTIGVTDGDGPVVVVIDGEDETAAATAVREAIDPADVLGTTRDPDRITAYYDITEAEQAATTATLEDLVIERVALLAVNK